MKQVAVAIMGVFVAGSVLAAPDWSKVPAKKVPVFFPGPTGIEWILTKSEHSAANQITEKNRPCTKCHDTDAVEIGDKMARGAPVGNMRQALETNAPKGKIGSFPVSVQAAYDDKKLYLRFEWEEPKPGGGTKMDPKNDMKLTVMFDDNKVEGANLNGCWSTCHMDLRTMPEASDAAKNNPNAKALGWSDGVTKYIKESRTGLEMKNKPRGGWDKLKSDADIEAALKEGKFMDLIQYRAGEKKSADGYVLESRHMDGGKSLVKAEGKKDGHKWVVTFERTLAGLGRGDHTIAAGKTYNMGFAIHEDYAAARFHNVSLGYSLGLDNAAADFNAVKQ
jgi:hypothetical protein